MSETELKKKKKLFKTLESSSTKELKGHLVLVGNGSWWGIHLWLFLWVKVLVAQSCPTVCDPIDYSLPGSSVHGILQARILESVAISFSMGSSQPRDATWVFLIAGRFFTICTTNPQFMTLGSENLTRKQQFYCSISS